MIYFRTDHKLYTQALGNARHRSQRIAAATSSPEEMPASYAYYLADDLLSGYGVAGDGTLVGVFSLEGGRGEDLIWSAILHHGADRLDCFDGYLNQELYPRFGFAEYERVPNWTPGEPDVVFMRLNV
ncbi:acetyltransferase [Streptomyces phage phiScoe10]|nr:acetyltransferase [Streptomyces phage phiScoe10]